MTIENLKRANEETREAWNHNAAFWNERMGEGNDFVEVLIWPATEWLLDLHPGERVLDIACGNGLSSRRLAAMGAEVVAFDFAEQMIAYALERTTQYGERIRYSVLDATDETALLELEESQFDAAICNMALFDMAEIGPLMRALARLLRPGGRFVFSVIHPCFNNPHMAHVAEMEDRAGEIVTIYSVKIFRYITPSVARGVAIPGQPKAQLYFHRPLQVLLGIGFKAGFVLDGLEERAFPRIIQRGEIRCPGEQISVKSHRYSSRGCGCQHKNRPSSLLAGADFMPLPSLVTRLAVRECHPQRSPVMFQKWRHLLFLHGEVEVGTIQRTLPPGLQVDTFEGKDYLGLILFMGDVHPRFLPSAPSLSNFQELSFPTCVYDRQGVPGIWFYWLDANQ